MADVIRIDDVIQQHVGEGRIVTGYALVAEVVNANDDYEIVTMTDGTSSPWKLEGLVNWAVSNGYLWGAPEEDEEGEDL